jgi:hypothetical protein
LGFFSADLRLGVEKLRFHCGSRTGIFSGMSAILKDEEFVAVEAAVVQRKGAESQRAGGQISFGFELKGSILRA